MKAECTLENGVLTISVAAAGKRFAQTAAIPIYDMLGVCRATVEVTLDGDQSIPLRLGDSGKQIVASAFALFADAVSRIHYAERGYTGMYQYYDARCPFSPVDTYNSKAFNSAYRSIAMNANIIRMLRNSAYTPAVPFFSLLNAILYTEMVDKWGRIGITESVKDTYDVPEQKDAVYTLRYLEGSLDAIADAFSDRKAVDMATTAEAVFDISKDVWRVARTNILMALGRHDEAIPALREIVDSRRYSVAAGNEYDPNGGTILLLNVPDDVMRGHTIGYYTYADVLLMLAECYLATGNEASAAGLIKQVADVKGMNLTGNSIDDIAALRKKLFIPRYFAFQKRNGLGGYEPYQYLWPIPSNQLMMAGTWTQNPGY